MRKIQVCISKKYFTPEYRKYMKCALFRLSEDFIQLPDCKNSRGHEIEVMEVETTENMAEVILAMSDYDMWYAEEIICN